MKLNPVGQKVWLSRIVAMFCLINIMCIRSIAQDASNIPVTGKVTVTGELSGTTVQVKGESKATVTDAEGRYKILAPRNGTLVFSRVGSKTVEVNVNGRTEINISLEAADNSLDQVVVVSYGKQRQRNLTSAITRLNANEVTDVAAAELGQKMNGKIAGLQINQSTGRPGQGMNFRIRGAASLSSSNQPLIVVDGQPITGDLNLLNPDDIESISVLKDAASSALYGSRAANGVILVTTKQGKVGRTSVTVNAYFGLQRVPDKKRPEVMNAREFAAFMNGLYQYKIDNKIDTSIKAVPDIYKNPDQYGEGTKWYDAMLRTAPIQNYSVNISTGTEKLLSSTSVSYFNQQGVMYNTGMQRFSFRSNNEYRPFDRIKLGFNVAPSYQIDDNTRSSIDGRGSVDGNRQVLMGALISSPLTPIHNPDGSYTLSTHTLGMLSNANHRLALDQMNNVQKTLRLLANAYLDIEFLKGLNFRTSINTDLGSADFNSFYSSLYGTFGAPPPVAPTASHNSYNYTSWLNENLLTYNFKVKEHTFDLLAGYTAQRYDYNYRNINGSGFAGDGIPWISGASTTNGSSNNTDWNLASWLGRVNYDFKNKYFISGTIRRDGSSKFGSNTKWGYFPSVSAGWVLSDESFFPENKIVSFAKLRASYGVTGNNNTATGNYNDVSLLTPTNYVFKGALVQGQSLTVLGNPDVTWETSKQFDVGIELAALNNRITFSYDYYNKTVEDMLYRVLLPMESGYNDILSNAGKFRMWGHEFQVTSRNLTGPLQWTTSFNVSFNDNKVVALQNGVAIGGVNRYSDWNRTAVGRRIGELWGYVFDGVYMTQEEFNSQPKDANATLGSTRMKDINGDKKIDENDRTFIGNPHPKMIFGMTNDFRYKNFDLNIIISGQTGNDIMNTNLQNLQNLDGAFNLQPEMLNFWRSPQNPGNGKVPNVNPKSSELFRLGNSNWVFPGDYLTVRNITLGYTFNKDRLKYLKSLRVYGSVQQAFVFSRYPGQNPEVNDTRDNQTTAGLDNGTYPVPRTFMIGANINF